MKINLVVDNLGLQGDIVLLPGEDVPGLRAQSRVGQVLIAPLQVHRQSFDQHPQEHWQIT